jgi:hypothetical protein
MTNPASPTEQRVNPVLIALAWLWVFTPFAYGVWQLLSKITQLFST